MRVRENARVRERDRERECACERENARVGERECACEREIYYEHVHSPGNPGQENRREFAPVKGAGAGWPGKRSRRR